MRITKGLTTLGWVPQLIAIVVGATASDWPVESIGHLNAARSCRIEKQNPGGDRSYVVIGKRTVTVVPLLISLAIFNSPPWA